MTAIHDVECIVTMFYHYHNVMLRTMESIIHLKPSIHIVKHECCSIIICMIRDSSQDHQSRVSIKEAVIERGYH